MITIQTAITMANEQKTLKQQNSLQIHAYVWMNIFVFWGLANRFPMSIQSPESVPEKIYTSALWSVLIGIITTVLSGQISPKFKYVLIFWRRENVLPACRAFSHFMFSDPRIDPKIISQRLGQIPTDPTEQNRVWFRIYKNHQDKVSVMDAHRNFLLIREISVLSFLFLLILGIASFIFFPSLKSILFYLLGLLSLYLLSAQAGKNYGARFVTNVLAEECTD